MNLFNIFKKETSKEVKCNVQKIDKNQLSKVIGGGDIVGAAVIGGAISKTVVPGGGPVIVGGSTTSGS
jgi:hypothetical protein